MNNVENTICPADDHRAPAAAPPTSRADIYYWKCDSPLPVEEKLVYNRKYKVADILPLVEQIGRDFFRTNEVQVRSAGGEGNHYTYVIEAGGRQVFFRADDGKIADDYMVAEGAAMHLAQSHGVRVPEVYDCDVSLDRYPVRFQIMELLGGRSLNTFHRRQTLDKQAIGAELGTMLGRLHGIRMDGFGFFDTRVLRDTGRVCGLDESNRAYFCKRLDDHLRQLRESGFLTAPQVADIEQVLDRHMHLLDIPKGSLLHKDMALWNIMGTENRVEAIIDWDDTIIGDPADDLGVLRCFYGDDILGPVWRAYAEIHPVDDAFRLRTSLYLVRNMLWKAVIRTFMKYFEMDGDFFLADGGGGRSLRETTYERLFLGVEELKRG
jgi:fructosamine-3-kinase